MANYTEAEWLMEKINGTEWMIGKINESMPIMKEVDDNENKIIECEEKIEKAKKRLMVLAVIFALFLVLCITCIALGIFSGILWTAIILAIILLQDNIRKKHKKTIADLTARNEELVNNPVLDWLPMTYRNGYDFMKIAEYVQNMRANTLQEAINLLETEKHQQRVELASLVNGNTIIRM